MICIQIKKFFIDFYFFYLKNKNYITKENYILYNFFIKLNCFEAIICTIIFIFSKNCFSFGLICFLWIFICL
jgi:hypothetical protein